jgi:hypothetical protein
VPNGSAGPAPLSVCMSGLPGGRTGTAGIGPRP